MLTYEEEMDRKYGISGKLDCVHDWEIKRIIEKMILEHKGEAHTECIFTGFTDFDEAIGGLHRGETYMLAARPGMGKTAFALSILEKLIKTSKTRILYLTTEKSREYLISRLLQIMSGNLIFDGKQSDDITDQWNLSEAGKCLSYFGENTFVDDRVRISLGEIFEDVSDMGEVDLIVVDYLQLMDEPEFEGLPARECQELLCEDLGILAKTNNCAVLILSCLPKAIEARRNHRPKLEDVTTFVPGRYVDNVIFLYRDEYYYHDTDDKGIAEFYIAKRKGMGDVPNYVNLAWIAEKGKFANIDKRLCKCQY